MILFWFLLFLFLLFIELTTINLVSIWFAIGALISCIVAMFIVDVNIQVIVFVITSIISLIITKPIVSKMRNKKSEATNLDRIIGQIGIVKREIKPLYPGEVKVDGKIWTAISDDQIVIDKKVKILKIDGVKLVVQEVKED